MTVVWSRRGFWVLVYIAVVITVAVLSELVTWWAGY